MKTGLFELLLNISQPDCIVRFLEKSSFDDLIEFDLSIRQFKSVYHIAKKYAFPQTGGAYEDMLSGMSEILIHPYDRKRFTELMNPDTLPYTLRSSELRGIICDEYRMKLIDGSWRWTEIVLIDCGVFGSEENTYKLYVYDIHSRKARELGLNDDILIIEEKPSEITGLMRKKAFTKAAVKLIKDQSVNWCIISIDIEHFTLFNEWYGHDEGDLLMAQIGKSLKDAIGKHGGAAGYFGMDDFCLVFPYDEDAINLLYDEINAIIASHGSGVGFLPSFGVCMVEDDTGIFDMIDRSILATRAAKDSFHSRIRMFDKKMYARTDKEYHILTDFIQALQKNEIVFYLQPQCRASSGKIVGAEALSRWIRSDGSIVPPDEFIPVLEKHGLITDLDLHIWEEVCKWQRGWIDKGMTPLPVSVNVSAIDILNADIALVFETLLNKYELRQDLLKIEITESAYISNSALVKETVRILRDKGFIVLMDDFGSGYSSLNMLKSLNIDIIKLDAQFLKMEKDSERRSIQIIESVASMTRTIGIPIIVEGVETKEQKDFLQDLGCRYIQGYYFYRPMPVQDYEQLIRDNDNTDTSGIIFKANQQFKLREILNDNVYSDNMLNNILGPCAFYARRGEQIDIVRFNEQFYRTVGIHDFNERMTDIGRFVPNYDKSRFQNLLDQADNDKLNGSKGILHFYKTDGTLSTFYMRFYYLRYENDEKLYYGAVQNITELSTLQKQMSLLSRVSPDTVIFLKRTDDDDIEFAVLFNGLEKVIGMNKEELEKSINSNELYDKINMLNGGDITEQLMNRIKSSESFVVNLDVRSASGTPVSLSVHGDNVNDDTGTVNYILTIRKIDEYSAMV